MTRANLHPNPLSGYSEDYPDPEDDPTRATSDADLSPGTPNENTPSHRQGGETT